jgi:hypothetical protein
LRHPAQAAARETVGATRRGAYKRDPAYARSHVSLFVDYQIPSDLLSFDGAADADVPSKVNNVKEYVKSVLDIIESKFSLTSVGGVSLGHTTCHSF